VFEVMRDLSTDYFDSLQPNEFDTEDSLN